MFNLSKHIHWGNYCWLLVSLGVLILDQLSKYYALAMLDLHHSVVVTAFFSLTLLFNSGAAFSLFNQAGGPQVWLLSIVSISAGLYLLYLIPKIQPPAKITLAGMSLLFGGAMGNLWDRLHYGYVIDFLHFHWSGWHFAVFNGADSAITLGTILLAFSVLTHEKETG